MDHSKCINGHTNALTQLQEKKLEASSSDSHRGQGSLPLEGCHEAAAGLPINEEPHTVTGTKAAASLSAMGPTLNVAEPAPLLGHWPTPAPPKLQPDFRTLGQDAVKDLSSLDSPLPSF